MKNLKDFKNKLKVGGKVYFRAHWTNGETIERTCTIKQSNAAAFTHPTKPENSWLYFPKAKQCIFTDHGVYIVDIAEKDYFKNLLNKYGKVEKSVIPYLFYSFKD